MNHTVLPWYYIRLLRFYKGFTLITFYKDGIIDYAYTYRIGHETLFKQDSPRDHSIASLNCQLSSFNALLTTRGNLNMPAAILNFLFTFHSVITLFLY